MHYEMYYVRVIEYGIGLGVRVYEFRQFADDSKCQNYKYKNLNSKI